MSNALEQLKATGTVSLNPAMSGAWNPSPRARCARFAAMLRDGLRHRARACWGSCSVEWMLLEEDNALT